MTRRARRIAFAVYAATLFVATHFPNLRIDVPNIERPDLLIHMGAFGGWTCLLIASELVGPWQAFRAIALCTLIAVSCAAIDEYSQSIPILNRTSAWDDFAANISGILLASAAALLLARFWKPGALNAPTEPTDPAAPAGRSPAVPRQADDSALGPDHPANR